jgi:hypothetical protein
LSIREFPINVVWIVGQGDGAKPLKALKEQLADELPDKITGSEFAAAVLRRSDLVEQYGGDFPAHLARMKKGGRKQLATTWIDRAERAAKIPLESAADAYLAMAFVAPGFAKEFAAERPQSVAFERAAARFTDRLSHEDKERWDDCVASTPTPRDRTHLPAMARALEVGKAEFSTFSEAHIYRLPKFEGRVSARSAYRRFLLPVRRAFEAEHGNILDEYWCAQTPVGTVRTAGGSSKIRVHFDGDYDECLVDIFNRCKEINRKGRRFLPGREYETLAGNLYGLLTDLLAAVDRAIAKAAKKDKDSAIASLDQEPFLRRVEGLEAELDDGSRREGQRWYIFGTVIGLLVIGAAFIVAGSQVSGNWKQIFEGAVFGAAGALASVFFRTKLGKLEVDAQQGKILIVVSALVKPLTGAIFGGIIAALVLSGLPHIKVPKSDSTRFFFLGVLAFIAGFSERWAPNLLQQTGERIAAEAASEGKPTPADAPAPTPA